MRRRIEGAAQVVKRGELNAFENLDRLEYSAGMSPTDFSSRSSKYEGVCYDISITYRLGWRGALFLLGSRILSAEG
jgi:hypothetical protein